MANYTLSLEPITSGFTNGAYAKNANKYVAENGNLYQPWTRYENDYYFDRTTGTGGYNVTPIAERKYVGTSGSALAGTGLKSSAAQGNYENYSRALGRNYNVDEFIPLYENYYDLSTSEGQAQYAADRAEAENVRRYYEILSGYSGMLDSGQSAVASAYDKAAASNLQNLTSRGLTGTTILNNIQTRNTVNKSAAMQNAYNSNLQNMLKYMERRNTGTGTLIQ